MPICLWAASLLSPSVEKYGLTLSAGAVPSLTETSALCPCSVQLGNTPDILFNLGLGLRRDPRLAGVESSWGPSCLSTVPPYQPRVIVFAHKLELAKHPPSLAVVLGVAC